MWRVNMWIWLVVDGECEWGRDCGRGWCGGDADSPQRPRTTHACIYTHRKNDGFVALVDSLAALRSHGADVTDIDGMTYG